MADLALLPGVAREAIRAHLDGRAPELPALRIAPSRPVFVTLAIDGVLRGCMGELEARHGDLVRETADRAVVAAFGDPRFPPLQPEELERCTIDVTVLGTLEAVASPADLDPRVYGIEVDDGCGRSAVLLPGLEGIDSAERQIAVTRRKAGIPDGVPAAIRRFRAVRVEER